MRRGLQPRRREDTKDKSGLQALGFGRWAMGDGHSDDDLKTIVMFVAFVTFVRDRWLLFDRIEHIPCG